MSEIAAFADDGMQRLARGGIEVGGILLGTRNGTALRIEAWRPIPCEHARGPSFLLSSKDETGLGQLLNECEANKELQGYEVLGWFHSHTRTELSFTEEDLVIHDRFFAELWMVALVLKPKRHEPVRAGFFLREEGGKLEAGASLLEFKIHPSKMPARPPRNEGPVRLSAAKPEAVPVTSVRVERRVASPFSFKWLTIVAVALMFLTGARIFLMNPPTEQPAVLPVMVTDQKGTLQIGWDHTLTVVREADSAQIRITDGRADVAKALDAESLHSGSFFYVRSSDDVQIKITLYRAGKQTAVEIARFVGPKLTNTVTERDPSILQLYNVIRENQRLQQQLKKESARANRLERSLRNLLAVTKKPE